MKPAITRLALSLTAVLCAAGALSIAAAQAPQTQVQRPQLPMSVADMQSRIHERVTGIDANHDGFVAAEEIAAHRAERRAERMQKHMARADTNRDGRVSTLEFEAAQLARIERADANRDGQITREEVQALRSQRRSAPRG